MCKRSEAVVPMIVWTVNTDNLSPARLEVTDGTAGLRQCHSGLSFCFYNQPW